MLVNITEFAEQRNEDRDTVNAYIRKHPEIQEYVSKKGKHTVIDTNSEGYQLLEKQYPLPQMVQIIEDTESRKELIKAQQVIIQLQQQLSEANKKIAQAEAIKMLLEDKESQLIKAEQRIEKEEKRAEKEEERANLLQKQLDMEKSKTWFQKLLGK